MAEDLNNPVIILGDLLDTKDIVRARVFNFVHKRLKASSLKFYILVGNHDKIVLQGKEHSLETLKELKNVDVIDEPRVHGDMLMLPYFHEKEDFREAVKNHKTKHTKYLFFHNGIKGFDYGNNYIATGKASDELHLCDVGGFKLAIGGHFHKFAREANLMFLGTPFSHSFGESNQVKYIGIFDSLSGEVELLETPFPRHRTVNYEISDDPKESAKSLKAQLNDQDHWRVMLRGTELQIAAFDQSAFPGIKFIEEPSDSEQVADVSIKDTDSNEQKFVVWARDIKGLDEDLLSMGLSLLREAT